MTWAVSAHRDHHLRAGRPVVPRSATDCRGTVGPWPPLRRSSSTSADARCASPTRTACYFPATGATKRDLAEYYLAVGPGIVNALRERPCMMHRFPTGVSGEKVHQKRVPARRAAVAGDRPRDVPALRPARRRAVRDRAGPRHLGGPDVDRRAAPVELAPGRRRAARRVAHRPRPDAAVPPGPDPARRPRRRTRSSTSSGRPGGRRRPAGRGCTSTSASRPTTASRTCGWRRWPSPARSSAGCRRT